MINGLDPILIFTFFKKLDAGQAAALKGVGFFSELVQTLSLPPIPIYLSEKITGLYVDSEEKSIDIETSVDTLLSGGDASINQKAITSVVNIKMLATKESLGLTILSALADVVLPLVTSKEYSVSYLNGATTIFGGLIHSFSVAQEANSTLISVSLGLIKPPKKNAIVAVANSASTSLNNVGGTPTGGSAPPATGPGPGGGATAPVRVLQP